LFCEETVNPVPFRRLDVSSDSGKKYFLYPDGCVERGIFLILFYSSKMREIIKT